MFFFFFPLLNFFLTTTKERKKIYAQMSFAYRNTDMVKVWNLERSHEHTGGWRQKVFHRCGCSLTFDNI